MRIRWEVEDGYVGKDRPHYTDIPDSEIEDLEGEELENYIEEWVREEFEQNISYYWDIVDY